MAAFSPKRASFWIRRDNGTRPAQRPGRERRSVADMETSLSWVLNVAHKKRQGDAPLLSEQPGPHGHPDVALPIHNRIPKKGCNGGKKQEKPLFLPAWDWQEATVTPHIVGKARVGEEGLGVKGEN